MFVQLSIMRLPTPPPADLDVLPVSLKIHQRGVQWKQGVVIYMMLYVSLLYDTTPIHCTPPPAALPSAEYPLPDISATRRVQPRTPCSQRGSFETFWGPTRVVSQRHCVSQYLIWVLFVVLLVLPQGQDHVQVSNKQTDMYAYITYYAYVSSLHYDDRSRCGPSSQGPPLGGARTRLEPHGQPPRGERAVVTYTCVYIYIYIYICINPEVPPILF